MDKECNDQYANGNFRIVKRKNVKKGTKIHRCVWQSKRKRDVVTGTIKKWKSRINIDGSKMVKGKDYNLRYALVSK